jgi:hypothetical protein
MIQLQSTIVHDRKKMLIYLVTKFNATYWDHHVQQRTVYLDYNLS